MKICLLTNIPKARCALFSARKAAVGKMPKMSSAIVVLLFMALLCLQHRKGYAAYTVQQQVVGVVADERGEALSGVSVRISGVEQGTSTNGNGRYELNAARGDTLVFAFIGYETQRITIGAASIINVTMQQSLASLDEVIVVGYGSQSKRKVSTAISKVSASDINHLPVTTPGSALTGLAAGVQVQSGSGDTPGEAPIIRIRGVGSLGAGNDPLYVVDGYPLPDATQFARISVSDIQSIEVLKDAASAAIYGSRAANGVVLVTTKRGQQGKTSFHVNVYGGIQNVYRRMEMMNKDEYLAYAKAARTASETQYPDVFDTPERLANTDWQDQIFQQAPMSEFQLRAQGGSENVQYSISGSTLKQDGTIKGTGYRLSTLRTNLDAILSNKLKIGVNFAPSFSRQDIQPAPGVGGPASYVPVYAALLMPPVVPARLENGDYGQNNVMPFTQYGFAETGIHSPLAVVDLYENKRSILGLLNNVYLSWQPLKDLVLKTQGGVTVAAVRQEEYVPSTLAYSTSPFANLSNPSLEGVQSQVASGRSVDWVWENTLDYSKSIADQHNIAGMLLFSMQKTDATTTATRGRVGTFANDLIRNPTAATDQIGSLTYGLSSFMSYALRINYDFKEKYLFTGSVRTDGSSRFGPDNRFGVFQSYSVGWRLIEEPFLQSQNFFDELKVRASYGETGNANIGDNTWMSRIVARNYSFGNQRIPGTFQEGFLNNHLTWEKNRQLDIGIETSFLKNRIYLTVDLYRKNTEGMLFSKELPAVVGYASSFYTNIGELKNEGIEVDLTSQNMTGVFKWSTNFNFSFNRTNVLDLGGSQSLNTLSGTSGWPNVYKIAVGEPLGNMYGFIIDGVIKSQEELDSRPQWPGSGVGSYHIRDVNGDGQLNEGDRTLLGNGLPDFVYGMTNNVSYKGFDLSFIIQGVLGSNIINGAARHTELWAGRFNAVNEMVNNYFDPQNPDRDVKFGRVGPRSGFGTASQLSNYAVYNGSFLRLRNMTLGYNLPASVSKKIFVQSARIYITGQNLFTISDYPGFNPEPSQYGASVYQPGSDQGTYPVNRSFMLGLNIGF